MAIGNTTKSKNKSNKIFKRWTTIPSMMTKQCNINTRGVSNKKHSGQQRHHTNKIEQNNQQLDGSCHKQKRTAVAAIT